MQQGLKKNAVEPRAQRHGVNKRAGRYGVQEVSRLCRHPAMPQQGINARLPPTERLEGLDGRT